VSELVVLDADDLGAGAVATVRLPTRVPYGLHGAWLAA
jgi:carotenoid cleavage dioxygenase-like enzyme